MPETPILILLAPSVASLDASKIARTPDGDPVILGLSLIQRTVLAARRAGYKQVLLLGGNGAGPPGPPPLPIGAASPRRSHLIQLRWSLRPPLSWRKPIGSNGWLQPRSRRPPGRRIPNRIVMLPAASALAAADALDQDGGARDLAAVEDRLARALRPAGADSRRDRSDGRGDARGRARSGAAAPQGAGQGHRWVHGAACRAADLASDFAPPRAEPRSRPIR